MDKEEVIQIVQAAVDEHGPAKAKEVLMRRVANDPDFEKFCTLHGAYIILAMQEAAQATKH